MAHTRECEGAEAENDDDGIENDLRGASNTLVGSKRSASIQFMAAVVATEPCAAERWS